MKLKTILDLYKNLQKIAEVEFKDIIESNHIIFSFSGRARKLRLHIIDGTFVDIWYSLDGGYSFHWEQRNIRNSVLRHDNAPHGKWKEIKTFPKHCHDGIQTNVLESHLPDKPENALREFLGIVRNKLIEIKRKEKGAF